MKARVFRYSAVAVLAHAAATIPHGLAHAGERAYLPAAANAFVALVIVLAPFVALALLHSGRLASGVLLLLASMLGALVFGLAFHYILPGSDNVGEVPAGPWWLAFQVTSALVAATEAAGVAVAGWALYALWRAPRAGGVR
jgi:hypothetical protein